MKKRNSTMKHKLKNLLLIAFVAVALSGMISENAFAASKLSVKASTKTINVGKTVQLKANKKVKWFLVKGKKYVKLTSKKSKTVKVKGLKAGTAVIKAKSGSKTKKVTIKILPELKVSPTSIKIQAGKSVTLKSNNSAKWSVVNGSSVIKLSSAQSKSVLVTGVEAGSATVKITDAKTGVFKTVKVTVTPKPKKKALVIYFARGENIVDAGEYLKTLNDDIDAMTSASVLTRESGEITGNNGILADWIAEALGTKTYSIHVKTPYPNDKKETQSIVLNDEQVNGTLPEVEACTEDLSQYDIIYLGFPNWYGEPPRALYTFLNENDLNGKTIVPFTSHDKNGFSDSIDILKAKLPNSVVLEDGLVVNRKDVPEAKVDTLEWVERVSKEAETAEANPLATAAGQKEAAKKLIGQILTKDEVEAAVGNCMKFVTDTNG